MTKVDAGEFLGPYENDSHGKVEVVDKRRFTKLDIEPQETEPSDALRRVEEMMFVMPAQESFSPSSQPSTSPGMDFPTAMKQVIKGQRVTRLEWENPDIWLMMFYWGQINPKLPAGKYLSIHHADGVVSPLYIVDGDLLADDWIVVV